MTVSVMYLNQLVIPITLLGRASLLKLNQPLRRTNHGHNYISYIAPIIWNNLPNSLFKNNR